MENLRNAHPKQLSVSEEQRVIIGRAFSTYPDLLLMDEPYGQMDIKMRFYLEDEVLKLWKEFGSTVIFITHNIEEAIYLAGLASKVYLVVRKPYLRASKIMQERVQKHEKIEVLFEHNVVGLFGDNGVEGMNVVKRWGEADEERYSLPIDGFFLAIGHKPNSDIFKEYIDTDEVGYIITDGDSPRTKVPGVFAAGDVADPHYRQAITAAGSGCKAAIEAERYLSAKGII